MWDFSHYLFAHYLILRFFLIIGQIFLGLSNCPSTCSRKEKALSEKINVLLKE